MTERDVDQLVQNASIIRNRGKIQATVDNARAMMSASPSLVALAKSHEIIRKRAPRSVADLPKSTPQAEAFAKQLKSQGYRFVGPTSVYAFMQNVGVVNDHIHGCFRATDYPARPRAVEIAIRPREWKWQELFTRDRTPLPRGCRSRSTTCQDRCVAACA